MILSLNDPVSAVVGSKIVRTAFNHKKFFSPILSVPTQELALSHPLWSALFPVFAGTITAFFWPLTYCKIIRRDISSCRPVVSNCRNWSIVFWLSCIWFSPRHFWFYFYLWFLVQKLDCSMTVGSPGVPSCSHPSDWVGWHQWRLVHRSCITSNLWEKKQV